MKKRPEKGTAGSECPTKGKGKFRPRESWEVKGQRVGNASAEYCSG